MGTTDRKPADATATIGTVIGPDQGRDAIHVAVEPVTAVCTLRPGEHVGFVDGGAGVCDDPVGIVDPFLKTVVKRGEWFWMLVYPRQITSLRHVWSHPKFAEAGTDAATGGDDRAASRRWIEGFADLIDQDYDSVILAAGRWVASGEFTHAGSRDGYTNHYEMFPEFWDHYERVTGTRLRPGVDRAAFFTCSC